MLSIHFDMRELNEMMERLADELETQTMPIAGPIVIEEIRANAAQGQGPDGAMWPRYTKEYAAVRAKKKLRIDVVNLRVTGRYLDVDLQSEGRRISVPQSVEGQAIGLSSKRPHFGASQKAIDRIEHGVVDHVNRLT